MLNLIVAILLLLAILWAAKKFYFPTDMAQHPEKYPIRPGSKISKKDLAITLSTLQRWKKEGKITREMYDHCTDVCLSEMQQLSGEEPTESH